MEISNNKKEYQYRESLVFSCQYHVVFCPKYRRPVLVNNIQLRLKELLLEKQKEYKYKILEMEIMKDHLHLLIDVDPQIGIYKIINQIKGYTSRTIREEFPEMKSKLPSLWTRSKFISTVGSVSLETVKKYIEEQKGK